MKAKAKYDSIEARLIRLADEAANQGDNDLAYAYSRDLLYYQKYLKVAEDVEPAINWLAK